MFKRVFLWRGNDYSSKLSYNSCFLDPYTNTYQAALTRIGTTFYFYEFIEIASSTRR
jgi:hypothetical protein